MSKCVRSIGHRLRFGARCRNALGLSDLGCGSELGVEMRQVYRTSVAFGVRCRNASGLSVSRLVSELGGEMR